jgi:beta-lactamase regulating signal transducer with metallopeptidase domain
MSTLGLFVVKASALAAAAIAAQAALGRRASAATRHAIWTLAIVALLLLPVVSAVAPEWTAIRLPEAARSSLDGLRTRGERASPPARDAASDPPSGRSSGRPIDGSSVSPTTARTAPSLSLATTGLSWTTLLLVAYGLGVLMMAIRLTLDVVSMRRWAGATAPIDDDEWRSLIDDCMDRIGVSGPVAFLRSRERAMPMAVGMLRPAVVMPAVADMWTADRRRAVLLHELAHLVRHDIPAALLAAIARVAYWWHPGVWWIARQQRVECERACDDLAIAAGTPPRDYADHLLEIAYALGDRRAPALAVGMARPRQLEGRLLAVLDAARPRGAAGRRLRIAGIAVAAVVVVALAGARAGIASRAESKQAGQAAPRGASSRPDVRVPGQDGPPGTWEIRPSQKPGFVQVRASEGHSSWGSSVAIDRLERLTGAKLVDGPVHVSVRRDAGTFTFDGVLRSGVGAGTFTFAPDPTFPDMLAKRGLARPSAAEQYILGRSDVGVSFLDELSAQRYARPLLADLVRAAQNGVGLNFLREMGALGYHLGLVPALTYQRQNGVSPEYIRDLAAQGLTNLSPDDLVRARQHGVDPEYAKGLADLGYGRLSLDKLIELRNHGVDPEYARQFAALGYPNLPLDELIRMRNNGVDPEYIRQLASLGYRSLSLDDLVRLRNHGVDPEFVRDVQKVGYEHLDLKEYVSLREFGITPTLIEMANARAGKRLPLDQLKRLAANGWK